MYNEKIFDNKLPKDMLIDWSARMRGTAGFCYNKKSIKSMGVTTRSSRIVLSTKVRFLFSLLFYFEFYLQVIIFNY